MYLKSLAIKGFKSFADPAVLNLEPGVTVVVGPNGSGKSNVVDAMAWVLGAQSPKSVRAQKMDDIIFAGTQKRAALGRAEVSLTIDNSDGQLSIDFTEVTITRTLFRTGESDYAINGVSCRLLDVQDLLSDSGVGRQQHIIVSQGQIDAVLNARPEERRAIIEEAAGVLKYRKRKERAERRLSSTDENLNRLADLVREIRRQLRPLEKQANAARRHGVLVGELHALKLHLVGRELKALTGNLEQSRRSRIDLDGREVQLKSSLAEFDRGVFRAEAELTALGGSDVADILSRAQSLRERIRGQANVVGERQRRLQGEIQSAVDEGVVSSLESEAARIVDSLAIAVTERHGLDPEFNELDVTERRLATDKVSFEDTWGEGIGPAPVQAAEARTQLMAMQSASLRDTQESQRLADQLAALGGRHDRFMAARSEAQDVVQRLSPQIPQLENQVASASSDRATAESAVEAATERRRTADGEASRWQARADALGQALDAARSAAGADALVGADGVLGTLLDLVAIDDGWDAAVEAAAGQAMRAVVVDDVRNGRAALEALSGRDLAGAILALGSSRSAASTPTVGEPVRLHVRAVRPDVEGLLDAVFGGAIALDSDWRGALDVALAHPKTTVVTKDGDRFGPGGWSIGQAGTGATGAALEEAIARAEAAVADASAAAEAFKLARHAMDEIRKTRRAAEDKLRSISSELEKAVAAVERSTGQINDLASDRERLDTQFSAVGDRQASDKVELDKLQLSLPGLEAEEAAHFDRTHSMAEARKTLEDQSRKVASIRTDLEVRTAAVESRHQSLLLRQGEVEKRLERLVVEREAAKVRRENLQLSLNVVDRLAAELNEKRDLLAGWLDLLRIEQEAQSQAAKAVSEDLSKRRRERKSAERELMEVREKRGKLDLADVENNVRLETLTEAIRGDLDTEPAVAMEAELPEIAEGGTPEAKVRDLERELKLLGPINPLALQEFEELKERHEFLDSQLQDVKTTKRDLLRLIKEIDAEIVNVFSAAYADVATNFVDLFQTLFPGGRGAVKLTDPTDLLNCGVEIEAKPSGKNVKKLSLLSGGERSLTALGFLFAVFKSRPSPFYVMDEVEAALDDMNLHRFLALVQEFRSAAQLIIVSHQKRTMEAADVLYGVSMKPGGSSKVVSQKVEGKTQAEAQAEVWEASQEQR